MFTTRRFLHLGSRMRFFKILRSYFRALSHCDRQIGQRVALSLALLSTFHAPHLYSQQIVEKLNEERKGDDSDDSGGGGSDNGGQCLWVAAYAPWSEKGGDEKSYLKYLQKTFDYTDKKAVPGCFGKQWNQFCPGSNGKGARRERDGSIARYGSCWTPSTSITLAQALADFLGAPDKIDTSRRFRSGNWAGTIYDTYHWFMDSECR